MKKKLFALLAIMTLFTPACAEQTHTRPYPETAQSADIPANSDYSFVMPEELSFTEVAFQMKTSPVTSAASWLDYEIVNHTSEEFTYGEDFALFKEVNGSWEYVNTLPGAGFEDYRMILAPYSVNGGSLDIGYFYGELSEGSYRIEKDIFSEDTPYITVVEFVVANIVAGAKK